MGNNMPLVSVVIPTYNRAYLIQRTIESVINQTYMNLEIIIVDDASSDNTEELVSRIVDPRIKYIRHSVNQNGSVARNTGISAASGDYIAFLDSDDEWLPQKIAVQMDYISQNNIDNAVYYCQLYADRGIVKEIIPSKEIAINEPISDYLFINNGYIQTSTLLMSREIAEKIKFNPYLRKHQDYDFSMRLKAGGCRFIFIKDPLAIWHIENRADRVSNNTDYSISIDWLKNNEKYFSKKAKHAFLSKFIAPLASRRGEKLYSAKLVLVAILSGSLSVKNSIIALIKISFSLNFLILVQRLFKFKL